MQGRACGASVVPVTLAHGLFAPLLFSRKCLWTVVCKSAREPLGNLFLESVVHAWKEGLEEGLPESRASERDWWVPHTTVRGPASISSSNIASPLAIDGGKQG